MQSAESAGERRNVLATLTVLRHHLKTHGDDLEVRFLDYCAKNHALSRGQIFQDLFAVFASSNKQNGFFVEFGATNGIDLSNTWLLETQLNWTGILAEPARCWHEDLRRNRKARIDTRYVSGASGEKTAFKETTAPELSTVDRFLNHDFNPREVRSAYTVESISLNDLLLAHDAPALIDFMSIDTEGSEYDILRAFDFNRWQVQAMTIEHNSVQPARSNIHALMEQNGFVRVFEAISHWDDWYVQRRLLGF